MSEACGANIDTARRKETLDGPEPGWIDGHSIVVDGGISGAVSSGMVPPPEI